MKLGAFSISLNVKDIPTSRDFYKLLGFEVFAGDIDHGYLIMKNGDTIVGLYKGHIEDNTLTFNPGWNQAAQAVDRFDDVRDIQKRLKDAGVALETETDPDDTGIGHIILRDPDGNPILIDQHVGRPEA